ncbi:MAG: hypothetical protein V4857_02075 [Pseudomonadota bacterium]
MKLAVTLISLAMAGAALGANGETAQRANASYYVNGFDGGGLKFSEFKCVAPVFPANSASNEGVRRVDKAVRQWRDCFGRFSARFEAALPVEKGIPEEVIKVMSAADLAKAKTAMESVYVQIAADATMQNEQVSQGYEKWLAATKNYSNNSVQSGATEASKRSFKHDQTVVEPELPGGRKY